MKKKNDLLSGIVYILGSIGILILTILKIYRYFELNILFLVLFLIIGIRYLFIWSKGKKKEEY